MLSTGCATISRTLQPLGLTKAPGYNYDVRITGADSDVTDRIEEVSALFAKKGQPPATVQGLKRRTQSDRDLYLRVLRSRGYYDGKVEWSIDQAARPPVVTMKVTPGSAYTFSRFQIEGLPPEAASLATGDSLDPVKTGAPALAESVLNAETVLVAGLAAHGFPYTAPPVHEARIDRRSRTMDVVVHIDAGPHVRFGEPRVAGTQHVSKQFVINRLRFHAGEAYSPAKIDESRKILFASGVFSAVSITPASRGEVGPDGLAPINVHVTEGKPHTVGAGLKYSSADGIGGKAFWENRNLTGIADRLRAELEVSQEIYTGGLSYRRPDFYSVNQSLLLDAKAENDKPPAYDRYALSTSAGLERQFSRHLTVTGGLSLEQSSVRSEADLIDGPPEVPSNVSGTKHYTLFGLPLGLRYDGTDNLLDPSHGHRTLLSVTPFASVLGTRVQIAVMRATESFYVPLDSRHREIWATRLTLGSVVGAERNDIPADKRMYAGGGDSVRGYQYQFVGDIFPDSSSGKLEWKPSGGRSLLQAGTELRWKATERLGIVPFVEGAGVYDAGYPDFQKTFRWAAGLGLRYFTVAGPIRLDVGFPVNARKADDIFQIYISLGQAF
jgi:translocation and assembly module TamA